MAGRAVQDVLEELPGNCLEDENHVFFPNRYFIQNMQKGLCMIVRMYLSHYSMSNGLTDHDVAR